MKVTLDRITGEALDALGPCAEVSHNEDAGTFVISEWHDCDTPEYVIPEASAVKFLRWLGRERLIHIKAAQREARRLTTPKERKLIAAAYKAWDAKYPYPEKPAA